MDFSLPGKNCGACGFETCELFSAAVSAGTKTETDCIYFKPHEKPNHELQNHEKSDESASILELFSAPKYSGIDIIGMSYDFVLKPFPNEPAARKIILPFRSDLVEKWNIQRDDLVIGRPAGAGCPVQHAIQVLNADPITGVIEGHVLSPLTVRGNSNVKDLKMYHMIGFEGIAQIIHQKPEFGKRYSFLPSGCMMQRAHSGLVNLVISTPVGLHVRVEGVMVL